MVFSVTIRDGLKPPGYLDTEEARAIQPAGQSLEPEAPVTSESSVRLVEEYQRIVSLARQGTSIPVPWLNKDGSLNRDYLLQLEATLTGTGEGSFEYVLAQMDPPGLTLDSAETFLRAVFEETSFSLLPVSRQKYLLTGFLQLTLPETQNDSSQTTIADPKLKDHLIGRAHEEILFQAINTSTQKLLSHFFYLQSKDLMGKGESTRATRALEKALLLNPENTVVLVSLGAWGLDQTSRSKKNEGIRYLERAYQLGRHDDLVVMLLATEAIEHHDLMRAYALLCGDVNNPTPVDQTPQAYQKMYRWLQTAPQPWMEAASYWAKKGEFDVARKYLQCARNIHQKAPNPFVDQDRIKLSQEDRGLYEVELLIDRNEAKAARQGHDLTREYQVYDQYSYHYIENDLSTKPEFRARYMRLRGDVRPWLEEVEYWISQANFEKAEQHLRAAENVYKGFSEMDQVILFYIRGEHNPYAALSSTPEVAAQIERYQKILSESDTQLIVQLVETQRMLEEKVEESPEALYELNDFRRRVLDPVQDLTDLRPKAKGDKKSGKEIQLFNPTELIHTIEQKILSGYFNHNESLLQEGFRELMALKTYQLVEARVIAQREVLRKRFIHPRYEFVLDVSTVAQQSNNEPTHQFLNNQPLMVYWRKLKESKDSQGQALAAHIEKVLSYFRYSSDIILEVHDMEGLHQHTARLLELFGGTETDRFLLGIDLTEAQKGLEQYQGSSQHLVQTTLGNLRGYEGLLGEINDPNTRLGQLDPTVLKALQQWIKDRAAAQLAFLKGREAHWTHAEQNEYRRKMGVSDLALSGYQPGPQVLALRQQQEGIQAVLSQTTELIDRLLLPDSPKPQTPSQGMQVRILGELDEKGEPKVLEAFSMEGGTPDPRPKQLEDQFLILVQEEKRHALTLLADRLNGMYEALPKEDEKLVALRNKILELRDNREDLSPEAFALEVEKLSKRMDEVSFEITLETRVEMVKAWAEEANIDGWITINPRQARKIRDLEGRYNRLLFQYRSAPSGNKEEVYKAVQKEFFIVENSVLHIQAGQAHQHGKRLQMAVMVGSVVVGGAAGLVVRSMVVLPAATRLGPLAAKIVTEGSFALTFTVTTEAIQGNPSFRNNVHWYEDVGTLVEKTVINAVIFGGLTKALKVADGLSEEALLYLARRSVTRATMVEGPATTALTQAASAEARAVFEKQVAETVAAMRGSLRFQAGQGALRFSTEYASLTGMNIAVGTYEAAKDPRVKDPYQQALAHQLSSEALLDQLFFLIGVRCARFLSKPLTEPLHEFGREHIRRGYEQAVGEYQAAVEYLSRTIQDVTQGATQGPVSPETLLNLAKAIRQTLEAKIRFEKLAHALNPEAFQRIREELGEYERQVDHLRQLEQSLEQATRVFGEGNIYGATLPDGSVGRYTCGTAVFAEALRNLPATLVTDVLELGDSVQFTFHPPSLTPEATPPEITLVYARPLETQRLTGQAKPAPRQLTGPEPVGAGSKPAQPPVGARSPRPPVGAPPQGGRPAPVPRPTPPQRTVGDRNLPAPPPTRALPPPDPAVGRLLDLAREIQEFDRQARLFDETSSLPDWFTEQGLNSLIRAVIGDQATDNSFLDRWARGEVNLDSDAVPEDASRILLETGQRVLHFLRALSAIKIGESSALHRMTPENIRTLIEATHSENNATTTAHTQALFRVLGGRVGQEFFTDWIGGADTVTRLVQAGCLHVLDDLLHSPTIEQQLTAQQVYADRARVLQAVGPEEVARLVEASGNNLDTLVPELARLYSVGAPLAAPNDPVPRPPVGATPRGRPGQPHGAAPTTYDQRPTPLFDGAGPVGAGSKPAQPPVGARSPRPPVGATPGGHPQSVPHQVSGQHVDHPLTTLPGGLEVGATPDPRSANSDPRSMIHDPRPASVTVGPDGLQRESPRPTGPSYHAAGGDDDDNPTSHDPQMANRPSYPPAFAPPLVELVEDEQGPTLHALKTSEGSYANTSAISRAVNHEAIALENALRNDPRSSEAQHRVTHLKFVILGPAPQREDLDYEMRLAFAQVHQRNSSQRLHQMFVEVTLAGQAQPLIYIYIPFGPGKTDFNVLMLRPATAANIPSAPLTTRTAPPPRNAVISGPVIGGPTAEIDNGDRRTPVPQHGPDGELLEPDADGLYPNQGVMPQEPNVPRPMGAGAPRVDSGNPPPSDGGNLATAGAFTDFVAIVEDFGVGFYLEENLPNANDIGSIINIIGTLVGPSSDRLQQAILAVSRGERALEDLPENYGIREAVRRVMARPAEQVQPPPPPPDPDARITAPETERVPVSNFNNTATQTLRTQQVEPQIVAPAAGRVVGDNLHAQPFVESVSEFTGRNPMTDTELARNWLPTARIAGRGAPVHTGVRILETHGSGRVLHVQLPNSQTAYFRPLTYQHRSGPIPNSDVRKSYVATMLNEALHLETVPRGHLAMINGELGLLSEALPRETRTTFRNTDPASLSDMVAFEFLVGNADARGLNIIIEEGKPGAPVKVIDHGDAFVPGLLEYKYGYPAGTHLPDRYTRRFVTALRAMDEATLRARYGDHLTEPEIAGLLFRRRVILADIELRGEAVMMDAPDQSPPPPPPAPTIDLSERVMRANLVETFIDQRQKQAINSLGFSLTSGSDRTVSYEGRDYQIFAVNTKPPLVVLRHPTTYEFVILRQGEESQAAEVANDLMVLLGTNFRTIGAEFIYDGVLYVIDGTTDEQHVVARGRTHQRNHTLLIIVNEQNNPLSAEEISGVVYSNANSETVVLYQGEAYQPQADRTLADGYQVAVRSSDGREFAVAYRAILEKTDVRYLGVTRTLADQNRLLVYDDQHLVVIETGEVLSIQDQPAPLAFRAQSLTPGTVTTLPGAPQQVYVRTGVDLIPESRPNLRNLVTQASEQGASIRLQAKTIRYQGHDYLLAGVNPEGRVVLWRYGVANEMGYAQDYLMLGETADVEIASFSLVPLSEAQPEKHLEAPATLARFLESHNQVRNLFLTEVLPSVALYFRQGARFVVQSQNSVSQHQVEYTTSTNIFVSETVENVTKHVYARDGHEIVILAPNQPVENLPTVQEIVEFLNQLPPELIAGLNRIELLNLYHQAGGIAQMGPHGVMEFFINPLPDAQYDFRTSFLHELGHHVALQIFGDQNLRYDTKWILAMQQDGQNPTLYAKDSIAEDFAETVKVYFMTGGGRVGEARALFSNRFAILDQLFADGLVTAETVEEADQPPPPPSRRTAINDPRPTPNAIATGQAIHDPRFESVSTFDGGHVWNYRTTEGATPVVVAQTTTHIPNVMGLRGQLVPSHTRTVQALRAQTGEHPPVVHLRYDVQTPLDASIDSMIVTANIGFSSSLLGHPHYLVVSLHHSDQELYYYFTPGERNVNNMQTAQTLDEILALAKPPEVIPKNPQLVTYDGGEVLHINERDEAEHGRLVVARATIEGRRRISGDNLQNAIRNGVQTLETQQAQHRGIHVNITGYTGPINHLGEQIEAAVNTIVPRPGRETMVRPHFVTVTVNENLHFYVRIPQTIMGPTVNAQPIRNPQELWDAWPQPSDRLLLATPEQRARELHPLAGPLNQDPIAARSNSSVIYSPHTTRDRTTRITALHHRQGADITSDRDLYYVLGSLRIALEGLNGVLRDYPRMQGEAVVNLDLRRRTLNAAQMEDAVQRSLESVNIYTSLLEAHERIALVAVRVVTDDEEQVYFRRFEQGSEVQTAPSLEAARALATAPQRAPTPRPIPVVRPVPAAPAVVRSPQQQTAIDAINTNEQQAAPFTNFTEPLTADQWSALLVNAPADLREFDAALRTNYQRLMEAQTPEEEITAAIAILSLSDRLNQWALAQVQQDSHYTTPQSILDNFTHIANIYRNRLTVLSNMTTRLRRSSHVAVGHISSSLAQLIGSNNEIASILTDPIYSLERLTQEDISIIETRSRPGLITPNEQEITRLTHPGTREIAENALTWLRAGRLADRPSVVEDDTWTFYTQNSPLTEEQRAAIGTKNWLARCQWPADPTRDPELRGYLQFLGWDIQSEVITEGEHAGFVRVTVNFVSNRWTEPTTPRLRQDAVNTLITHVVENGWEDGNTPLDLQELSEITLRREHNINTMAQAYTAVARHAMTLVRTQEPLQTADHTYNRAAIRIAHHLMMMAAQTNYRTGYMAEAQACYVTAAYFAERIEDDELRARAQAGYDLTWHMAEDPINPRDLEVDFFRSLEFVSKAQGYRLLGEMNSRAAKGMIDVNQPDLALQIFGASFYFFSTAGNYNQAMVAMNHYYDTWAQVNLDDVEDPTELLEQILLHGMTPPANILERLFDRELAVMRTHEFFEDQPKPTRYHAIIELINTAVRLTENLIRQHTQGGLAGQDPRLPMIYRFIGYLNILAAGEAAQNGDLKNTIYRLHAATSNLIQSGDTEEVEGVFAMMEEVQKQATSSFPIVNDRFNNFMLDVAPRIADTFMPSFRFGIRGSQDPREPAPVTNGFNAVIEPTVNAIMASLNPEDQPIAMVFGSGMSRFDINYAIQVLDQVQQRRTANRWPERRGRLICYELLDDPRMIAHWQAVAAAHNYEIEIHTGNPEGNYTQPSETKAHLIIDLNPNLDYERVVLARAVNGKLAEGGVYWMQADETVDMYVEQHEGHLDPSIVPLIEGDRPPYPLGLTMYATGIQNRGRVVVRVRRPATPPDAPPPNVPPSDSNPPSGGKGPISPPPGGAMPFSTPPDLPLQRGGDPVGATPSGRPQLTSVRPLSDHARTHIADPLGRPLGANTVVLDPTRDTGAVLAKLLDHNPVWRSGEASIERPLPRVYETGGAVEKWPGEDPTRYVRTFYFYEDGNISIRPTTPAEYEAYLEWKKEHGFPQVTASEARQAWERIRTRLGKENIELQIGTFGSESSIEFFGGALVYFGQLLDQLPVGCLQNTGIARINLFSSTSNFYNGTLSLHHAIFRGSPEFMAAQVLHELGQLEAQRFWDNPFASSMAHGSPPPVSDAIKSQVYAAYNRLTQRQLAEVSTTGDPEFAAAIQAGQQNAHSHAYRNYLARAIFYYVVAGSAVRAELRNLENDHDPRYTAALEIYEAIRDNIFEGVEFDYTFVSSEAADNVPNLFAARRQGPVNGGPTADIDSGDRRTPVPQYDADGVLIPPDQDGLYPDRGVMPPEPNVLRLRGAGVPRVTNDDSPVGATPDSRPTPSFDGAGAPRPPSPADPKPPRDQTMPQREAVGQMPFNSPQPPLNLRGGEEVPPLSLRGGQEGLPNKDDPRSTILPRMSAGNDDDPTPPSVGGGSVRPLNPQIATSEPTRVFHQPHNIRRGVHEKRSCILLDIDRSSYRVEAYDVTLDSYRLVRTAGNGPETQTIRFLREAGQAIYKQEGQMWASMKMPFVHNGRPMETLDEVAERAKRDRRVLALMTETHPNPLPIPSDGPPTLVNDEVAVAPAEVTESIPLTGDVSVEVRADGFIYVRYEEIVYQVVRREQRPDGQIYFHLDQVNGELFMTTRATEPLGQTIAKLATKHGITIPGPDGTPPGGGPISSPPGGTSPVGAGSKPAHSSRPTNHDPRSALPPRSPLDLEPPRDRTLPQREAVGQMPFNSPQPPLNLRGGEQKVPPLSLRGGQEGLPNKDDPRPTPSFDGASDRRPTNPPRMSAGNDDDPTPPSVGAGSKPAQPPVGAPLAAPNDPHDTVEIEVTPEITAMGEMLSLIDQLPTNEQARFATYHDLTVEYDPYDGSRLGPPSQRLQRVWAYVASTHPDLVPEPADRGNNAPMVAGHAVGSVRADFVHPSGRTHRVAAATRKGEDPGKLTNEDSYVIGQKSVLGADAMGGHVNGPEVGYVYTRSVYDAMDRGLTIQQAMDEGTQAVYRYIDSLYPLPQPKDVEGTEHGQIYAQTYRTTLATQTQSEEEAQQAGLAAVQNHYADLIQRGQPITDPAIIELYQDAKKQTRYLPGDQTDEIIRLVRLAIHMNLRGIHEPTDVPGLVAMGAEISEDGQFMDFFGIGDMKAIMVNRDTGELVDETFENSIWGQMLKTARDEGDQERFASLLRYSPSSPARLDPGRAIGGLEIFENPPPPTQTRMPLPRRARYLIASDGLGDLIGFGLSMEHIVEILANAETAEAAQEQLMREVLEIQQQPNAPKIDDVVIIVGDVEQPPVGEGSKPTQQPVGAPLQPEAGPPLEDAAPNDPVGAIPSDRPQLATDGPPEGHADFHPEGWHAIAGGQPATSDPRPTPPFDGAGDPRSTTRDPMQVNGQEVPAIRLRRMDHMGDMTDVPFSDPTQPASVDLVTGLPVTIHRGPDGGYYLTDNREPSKVIMETAGPDRRNNPSRAPLSINGVILNPGTPVRIFSGNIIRPVGTLLSFVFSTPAEDLFVQAVSQLDGDPQVRLARAIERATNWDELIATIRTAGEGEAIDDLIAEIEDVQHARTDPYRLPVELGLQEAAIRIMRLVIDQHQVTFQGIPITMETDHGSMLNFFTANYTRFYFAARLQQEFRAAQDLDDLESALADTPLTRVGDIKIPQLRERLRRFNDTGEIDLNKLPRTWELGSQIKEFVETAREASSESDQGIEPHAIRDDQGDLYNFVEQHWTEPAQREMQEVLYQVLERGRPLETITSEQGLRSQVLDYMERFATDYSDQVALNQPYNPFTGEAIRENENNPYSLTESRYRLAKHLTNKDGNRPIRGVPSRNEVTIVTNLALQLFGQTVTTFRQGQLVIRDRLENANERTMGAIQTWLSASPPETVAIFAEAYFGSYRHRDIQNLGQAIRIACLLGTTGFYRELGVTVSHEGGRQHFHVTLGDVGSVHPGALEMYFIMHTHPAHYKRQGVTRRQPASDTTRTANLIGLLELEPWSGGIFFSQTDLSIFTHDARRYVALGYGSQFPSSSLYDPVTRIYRNYVLTAHGGAILELHMSPAGGIDRVVITYAVNPATNADTSYEERRTGLHTYLTTELGFTDTQIEFPQEMNYENFRSRFPTGPTP